MTDDTFRQLQAVLREFAVERDWEQFHLPKNLVIALLAEAGELAEPFQWLTAEQADEIMRSPRATDVEDELADVAIYLLRLADVLGVDLREAVERKLERNRSRFPTDKVHGRADLPPEAL
jgi:dCTP diphosphatase